MSTTEVQPVLDVYRLSFVMGHRGLPGAPLLYAELLVNAKTGEVAGHAQIRQAITPPSTIEIDNVTGKVIQLFVLGQPSNRMVFLRGSYSSPIEPLQLEFTAALLLEPGKSVGSGSFTYGGHKVDDVPVGPDSED